MKAPFLQRLFRRPATAGTLPTRPDAGATPSRPASWADHVRPGDQVTLEDLHGSVTTGTALRVKPTRHPFGPFVTVQLHGGQERTLTGWTARQVVFDRRGFTVSGLTPDGLRPTGTRDGAPPSRRTGRHT
jgi:hypothetical protein